MYNSVFKYLFLSINFGLIQGYEALSLLVERKVVYRLLSRSTSLHLMNVIGTLVTITFTSENLRKVRLYCIKLRYSALSPLKT